MDEYTLSPHTRLVLTAPVIALAPLAARARSTFLPSQPHKTGPGGQAELRSNQIQELADQISDITLAAAGLDLKFNVQIEVSGTNPGSADAVAKLNQLLGAIAEDLKLQ